VKPLLQKQAFQKQEGMIGIVVFSALAERIVSQHLAFNPGPVDDTFFHILLMARLRSGELKRAMSSKERRDIFLKLIFPSGGVNLEEVWQKITECCICITRNFVAENHRNCENGAPSCAKLSVIFSGNKQP
jgi:hypothetical protein